MRPTGLNEKTIAGLLLAFFLITLLRVLRAPLRLALRLLGTPPSALRRPRCVRATAALTGITLGLNTFNALVIGILGLPGFVLLLLTQWVLENHIAPSAAEGLNAPRGIFKN
ncbi:MAG: pro-sigmaK processing inhibitor BofA family protein [Oscillospiraceae bacterium]